MSKPIAPLVCFPDIARMMGATLCIEPSDSFVPAAIAVAIIQAAKRIGERGDIPVLTHGQGAVWAWPLQPGARHSGVGF